MGNIISNYKVDKDKYFRFTNGETSVLIATLVLSGSSLANSEWEKKCIIWLASHDQAISGLGVAGFDIDEIAWTKSEFQNQKEFIFNVIDLALNKHNWHLLDYKPPYAHEYLQQFKELIEEYKEEYVESDKIWDLENSSSEPDKCSKHMIFLHENGCVICNYE
jgi:hypothetical protein